MARAVGPPRSVSRGAGRLSRTAALQPISRRALNRATLARQLLLDRANIDPEAAISHLVGLQAQTPRTWYVGLWARLAAFDPTVVSDLLAARRIVRLALMRSTIHLVTAEDAWGLRALVQPVIDRGTRGTYGRLLEGIDLDELEALTRAYVDPGPRTFAELADHLALRWPDADRPALQAAARARVALVQTPPRGLWRRSGKVAHTSLEAWLERPGPSMAPEELVRRYLAAFGPASVLDAQTWSGLTGLAGAFDGMRADLVAFRAESGREVFDLPEAPRPDPASPAPVRFLYDYDNIFLSHRDRSRMFHPDPYRAIELRTNEIVSGFLVDGVLAGFWDLKANRGQPAVLRLRPVVRLSAAERRDVEAEAQHLLGFLAVEDGAIVFDDG